MRPLLFLLIVAAAPLGAQVPVLAPAPSVLFASQPAGLTERPAAHHDSTLPATRTQNAISLLGGAVGAAGGYLLANSLGGIGGCPDGAGATCNDETPLGWRIGGAAVGGAAGYLVTRGLTGRWSQRSPKVVAVDSLPEDRGTKWWQGAVIGGIVGGVGAPIFVQSFRLNEQGDGVPAIVFAPIGALLGLVVGGSLAQAH